MGKFESNVERDRRVLRRLKAQSWQVIVVWECDTRVESHLLRKLLKKMPDTRRGPQSFDGKPVPPVRDRSTRSKAPA